MFKRILVPLDGSPRAEAAISVAADLARASNGSIVLLRVLTAAIDFAWSVLESPQMMQGPLDAEYARVTEYLEQVSRSNGLSGMDVETVMLSGEPAPVIFSVAHTHKADLIVMCSHGYTGFKRWSMGSVAQKVARYSHVPVLVLKEHGGVPTKNHPDGVRSVSILVGLDGSPLAEAALVPAAQLSAALSTPAQGALHLNQVVKLPSGATPEEYKNEIGEKVVEHAKVYLAATKKRLQEELKDLKLSISWSVSLETDVAEALIRAAEQVQEEGETGNFAGCDLIAMATHGRGGLQRWMVGSITERVLGATKHPMLIVRPQKVDDTVKKDEVTAGDVKHESQSWVGLL